MLCRKLKDKNQTGQQQKQAFTDQGKIDVLKYKKANISTKKLVEFLTEKFMDCLPIFVASLTILIYSSVQLVL